MNRLKLTRPFSFGKGIIAKKSIRLLLEVVGSVLALVLLLLLLLLGRLSMGPINLDFLTPDVEAALKTPKNDFKTAVQHTQLVWREWRRPFEIELVNVHFQKDGNPDWLNIEHIGVSLYLHRLLVGEIALKHMRLYRPHVLLDRNAQGKFSLELGDDSSDHDFSFEEISSFLALGAFNPALGKLNDLKKISIIDAHVVLKDDQAGQRWELPKATFVLRRKVGGFQTDLTLTPLQGQGLLALSLSHTLGEARFDVTANFQQVALKSLIEKDRPALYDSNPDSITPDDILNLFQHWDVPLNGKVLLSLVPSTFEVIEGRGDVDFGKGDLDLSLANLRPLPLAAGNISFTLSPEGIDLKNASLLSEEMLLQVSGKISSFVGPLVLTKLLGPDKTLELQGKVEDLSLDHLAALWPQNLAAASREWLTENLRTGLITEATLSLKGHAEETGFVVDDLKGTLLGEGAEITYLKGLPAAQDVKATATFDNHGFDIKLLSGKIETFQLQEGRIVISGLDVEKETLALDIKGKGPLSDVLDIINHKPLEYASYGGIDPAKTKGSGSINLHMDFPLLADLRFKDVKMILKGDFKGVELDRKITDELTAHLREGALSIDLTEDQMKIQGTGVLNQLSSSLLYTHYFTTSNPYELQMQIDTVASFADFKRLGFNYEEHGNGPTKAKFLYTLEKDKKSRFLVDLDITSATLVFPAVDWEKKPGEFGSLSFELLFERGHLSKMTALKMVTSVYSLQGEIFFDPQQAWETIHLSEVKGPHTQTQVILNIPRKNAYEVSFKGDSVDLEKFLAYVDKPETEKDYPLTDIKLFADVKQLRLGEGKIFQNVQATADLFLQGKESLWKEVKLRAKAGEGTSDKGDVAHVSGGILFDLTPGLNNTQTLTVRANDAGQFLKNLSIYDEVQGGELTIKAERQNHGPYKGIFKLKEFNASKVPLLARFAAILSPVGIVNLFSADENVFMERFDCDFVFDDSLVVLKKGIGKSLSLGFTVEGKLDRINRTYGLKGNLIPARFLNSILNNIPILGPLLSGGEGEGLFAMSYTVTGPFDKPDVSANPLSMLAPGFLRKLFSPDEEGK